LRRLGPLRNLRKGLGQNRPALLSLVFILAIALASALASILSPYGAGGLDEEHILEGPSLSHWMGTDGLGRDVFTRVLFGARVSLTVGVGTSLLALFIGTLYGLASGYARPRVDNLLMRLVDVFYSLPDLLVFILLSLVLGRNVPGLLISLGLVTWVRFARLTRGEVLQAKESLYVEGARAVGAGNGRILLCHILPNIMGPIIVTLTFMIPGVILAESTLSFIGLGINDPYNAWGTSWGTLAQDGWRAMRTYPHVIFFPGAAIFLTILSFNFIGNAFRDIMDPRDKVR